MRMYDVITKKKRGLALSEDEIRGFVEGYTNGTVPDYQASALLMAICLNGMNKDETFALTDAICRSGDTVDLSAFGDATADKHSTGGVGDKTTLIVAPLAAALGCKVAKMSGRGLGHTGGTIDKLESFKGYNVSLSPAEFKRQVNEIGIAVVGQSGNLAPADKKIYALRDVTATVDSIPLITSSVMGKKIAAGSHNIVLDVKCGSGAFIKNPEDARALAESMVSIGKLCGKRCAALITNMDIPLGNSVGNIIEVKEAIATLRGEGPADLTEISVSLAAMMAHFATGVPLDAAKEKARAAISDGMALRKFKEWISAQGGDPRLIDEPDLFPGASVIHEVRATRSGYISKMDAEAIGIAAMELGAGRRTKDDVIDYTAGITLLKKYGDAVKKGDVLAVLYTSSENSISEAESIFLASITVEEEAPVCVPLIYDTVL